MKFSPNTKLMAVGLLGSLGLIMILKRKGVEPPPPPPPEGWLTVSPTYLDFGDTPMNNYSSSMIITVENISDLPVSFQQLIIDDPQFSFVSGDLSYTNLSPGETADIELVFRPIALGAQTGILAITSNDPESPLQVPLYGVGTEELPTPAFNFGSVTLYAQLASDGYNQFYVPAVTCQLTNNNDIEVTRTIHIVARHQNPNIGPPEEANDEHWFWSSQEITLAPGQSYNFTEDGYWDGQHYTMTAGDYYIVYLVDDIGNLSEYSNSVYVGTV